MIGTRLRIAHLTPDMEVQHGGIARAVTGLAEAQQAAGHSVAVFAVTGRRRSQESQPPGFDLRVTAWTPSWRLRYAPNLVHAVRDFRPDVIHSHGLWTWFSRAAHSCAQHMGIPHVCAPHGMLDAWALRQSRHRKRIAMRLYQSRVLHGASYLHALVAEEAAAIRAYVPTRPVEIIPNAVPPVLLTQERSRTALEARYPSLAGRRVVLFLGRLHAKKGLHNLLDAWCLLGEQRRGWYLAIAGPDDGRVGGEVRRIIEREGMAESVGLLGIQTPSQAVEILIAAEFLVLPSFSEGFSMSVLEALACGTPVCISPACNFMEVVERGAGLVSFPTPVALRHNLGALMNLPAEERAAMGRRGRQLIGDRYTWDLIQNHMESLYTRVLSPSNPSAQSVPLPGTLSIHK